MDTDAQGPRSTAKEAPQQQATQQTPWGVAQRAAFPRAHLLGSCLHLPVLCLEVAVQDLHRAVVDALLLVRLQLLNLVQPAAVLHNGAEGVDLVGVANRLRLPDLQRTVHVPRCTTQ